MADEFASTVVTCVAEGEKKSIASSVIEIAIQGYETHYASTVIHGFNIGVFP